jgi:hypothetical protein
LAGSPRVVNAQRGRYAGDKLDAFADNVRGRAQIGTCQW